MKTYDSKYVLPDLEGVEFLMLMFDFELPLGEWGSWTDEQRKRVYDHYADKFYKASDNDIRRIRNRPNFLGDNWP